MGDAFSDHGCESPRCRFCGYLFPPEHGCFRCRRSQSGKPWRTPEEERQNGIRYNREKAEMWRREIERYQKEIKRFRAEARKAEKEVRKLQKMGPVEGP